MLGRRGGWPSVFYLFDLDEVRTGSPIIRCSVVRGTSASGKAMRCAECLKASLQMCIKVALTSRAATA